MTTTPEQAVIQAADIVLVSDGLGEYGYRLHGIFASFDEALAHVRKDSASIRDVFWQSSSDSQCEVLVAHERWRAIKQPIRLAHGQPASEGLREALILTQWMLETIDRTVSTNFTEVRNRIIANRAVLRAQPLTEPQRLGQEGEARLRRALEPFAQLAQRKANYLIRPNDPIVLEAVRALES